MSEVVGRADHQARATEGEHDSYNKPSNLPW